MGMMSPVLTSCRVLLMYLLVGCHSNHGRLVQGGYPYTSDDLSARQESILEKLRGDMTLTVNEEVVPLSLRDPVFGALFLRNLEGDLFSASVYQPPKPAPFVRRDRPELTDPSLLSSLMRNFCSVLMVNYWNVEWCHREEVRQFHLEMQGGQPLRAPDYSLGTYQRTVVVRERGDYLNQSARIMKMVDFFSDGQECHETNGHRSSEVHIQCCEGLHINNIHNNNNMVGRDGSLQVEDLHSIATLKAFSEPKVCAYQLVVCSPLLCPEKVPLQQEDDGQTDGQGHRGLQNQTLSEVMQSLSLKCILRPEEWWTYELCFNRGIRQYHAQDTLVQEEGSADMQHRQVILSEYSLGLAPTVLYENNTALGHRSLNSRDKTNLGSSRGGGEGGAPRLGSSGEDRMEEELEAPRRRVTVSEMGLGLPSPILIARGKGKVRSLKLEFTEGTDCDILTDTKRSTTVEIFCGHRDAIVDIIEDRTCHYYFKVHSALACGSPLLAPPKKKVLTVQFSPAAAE